MSKCVIDAVANKDGTAKDTVLKVLEEEQKIINCYNFEALDHVILSVRFKGFKEDCCNKPVEHI